MWAPALPDPEVPEEPELPLEPLPEPELPELEVDPPLGVVVEVGFVGVVCDPLVDGFVLPAPFGLLS